MVSARSAPEQPRPESIKETIEQILVAFVLAFVFRCFIVEAFVIPTGSMAPTLLGQHLSFRCPDCGHSFKADYQAYGSTGGDGGDPIARVPTRDGTLQPRALPIRCDNCGFKLPLQLPEDPDNDALGPPVRGGDRILVDKVTYLLEAPQRWDVVVFKSPYYGERIPPEGQPSPPNAYYENYIKRLVGKPGETLMILDGDIYVAPSAKPLEQLTPDDFTVQTKPWHVQQALWRIVYDNDHLPQGLARTYTDPRGARFVEVPWRQPWVSDSDAWDTSGRVFRFNGTGPSSLRFDRSSMPDKFPLTDWITYATTKMLRGSPDPDLFRHPGYDPNRDPINDVSDVMLALTYRRQSGEGPLRLSVSKAGVVFLAEFTPTGASLIRRDATGDRVIASIDRAGIGRGAGTRIELVNCDYRVSVRLDGREVLATTPEDFRPDVQGLIDRFHGRPGAPIHPPAELTIDASAQSCEIAHLSLWRDIYYLNRMYADLGGFFWGSPLEFPRGSRSYGLIRLGTDEYFTLGDNSIMSLDGRGWTAPINLPDEHLFVDAGRVPDRFLIGKAFFVYWPAGFRAFQGFPQLIPNVGDMRTIE